MKWMIAYANTLDAFIPELWAQESLVLLENNMIAASMVHRDFSDMISRFGDTVNTRIPTSLAAKRKTDDMDISPADVVATNVAVKLDQHVYVSFRIKDGEESKGFQSLRDFYLIPAMSAMAQRVDEIVLGERFNFLSTTSAGKLQTVPSKANVLDVVQAADELAWPTAGRNVIVSPAAKADLLSIEDFTHADKRGDGGDALKAAEMGSLFGLNWFMDQNLRNIATGATYQNIRQAGTVDLSAGYVAGTTVLATDGFASTSANDPVAGEWCTIAGDMTPQLITALANDGAITIWPGLKYAVANDAAITVYQAGAVNFTAGYATAHAKPIDVDGFSKTILPGAMVSLGITSAAERYGAVGTPTTTEVELNRASDTSISNNDVVGVGPAGSYNWAFLRDAVTLVSRPLAPPATGAGALSYAASFNGIGLRVVVAYEPIKQAHLVTIDILCGIKTLDTNKGFLFYS